MRRLLAGAVACRLGGIIALVPLPGAAALLGVGLVHPAPARADENAEARVLFERGNRRLAEALVARGDRRTRALEDALDAYVESLLLVRSRNAVFNAGVTLEALGRPTEAFAYFQEYVAFPGLDDDERAEGQARLDALRPEVAVLRVETTPAGAAIRVDRQDLAPLARAPAEVAVEPGPHVLHLALEGHRPRRVEVDTELGGTSTVVVTLEAEPRPPEAADPAPSLAARLVVESSGPPAALRVGGLRRAPARLHVLSLDPGTYALEALAPEHQPATTDIELDAGIELALRAELHPWRTGRRRLEPWPGVAAGAAGAAAAAAAGTSVGAALLADRFRETGSARQELSALRLARAADVMIPVAIALAVTALILYLVDDDVPPPPSRFERIRRARRVTPGDAGAVGKAAE